MSYALDATDKMPIVVLMNPNTNLDGVVNVRIHSECFTGDLFGSQRCECGEQLEFAMNYINDKGGCIIYLRQEGRGIGLINKLNAYKMQDKGLDTKEANEVLGFHADSRSYEDAVQILNDLRINKINVLTNNPDKLQAFVDTDIEVENRIPIIIPAGGHNRDYLKTKKDAFGHLL
jgi:GTP cyclohydrolase II